MADDTTWFSLAIPLVGILVCGVTELAQYIVRIQNAFLRWTPLLAAVLCFQTNHGVEFRQGDKVALLGNTFIEREQKYGYIETALMLANPGKNLTFRNLGWSGETVFGHSRSYFGPPSEGFGRLQKLVAQEKPTLILLYFGANASYEGKDGLENFLEGYGRLVKMLQDASGARLAILSPIPQEKLPPPLPSPDRHNADLALYTNALEGFAKKQNLPFVDFYKALGGGKTTNLAGSPSPLTDNGLHLTKEGYRHAASTILDALGQKPAKPGKNFEKLRSTIVAKNELFFHMHRPQNETYLFGFRKHEQGNNAAEIPKFLPLIQAKESEIHKLSK